MDEHIWNGEMDCGWEDLATLIKSKSDEFSSTMLSTVSFSPENDAKRLISNESMERLSLMATLLSEKIEDGCYDQYQDLENTQNASKILCWIILGSLTETALQIFLAFYISDYRRSQWQQWKDFPSEVVKANINSAISKLVEDGTICGSQGKSLKEAIKETIKEHSTEHPVQKVMFDELIQFYTAQKLLDDDEVSYLRTIQSNRNGIHSFEDRTIGTWGDLQYAVRFWCYLLDWIIYRLPDIPDYQ